MKKKNTFHTFFSRMDWNMLRDQKNLMLIIRDTVVRSKQRVEAMNRFLKLIDFWLSFENTKYSRTSIAKAIKNFDWEQLKSDKRLFINIQSLKSVNGAKWEAMEGILNGIDSFQDAAVDDLKVDENKVFNLSKN
jgi:hypothetical protein